ncbi:MAG: methyltransferase domain-containing protein [Silicimonas sp.]|nr:methyltransferase domain-containing protein [Silicimonas sp.]
MMNVSFAQPREMVEFDGERCTPWVETQILSAHIHRYLSVLELCQGKRVLDIACGEGYGAAMLIRNGAACVTGVDIDAEAVARANRVYAHDGLGYAQGDIRQPLPLDDDAFDVIVCFETIEHIAEHDAFIAELDRVLAPGGVVVISTPDARTSDPDAPNPFHAKELTEAEFLNLIGKTFEHVSTCYQGFHFGSVITREDGSGASQNWSRQGFLDYAEDQQLLRRYVIAVASHDAEVDIPIGLLHDGLIIASLNKRIRALEAELASARAEQTTVST